MRRLKARPSLLELIARHDEGVGSRSSSPPGLSGLDYQLDSPQLPPLPVSPTSSSCSHSSSSSPPPSSPIHLSPSPALSTPAIHLPAPRIMAPSADDGETQHGSVFSVSGPVVVAEHMIGCAMYELVCFPMCFPTARYCASRFTHLQLLIANTGHRL